MSLLKALWCLVVKAIDGRGNASTLFYTDCFGGPNGEAQTTTDPTELGSTTKTFAFATEVRNVLNQSVFAQFDYYLGRPVDAKDENGVVASGYFNDSLDRPTEIRRAVGTALENRTVHSYDATNRIITTINDRDTNNDGILVSKLLYDQMGRTVETRQYEGSTNYIATQTQSDALGRAFKTSNPFRPWQSQTAVWTTQAFDALGRVVSITTPDNAVGATGYSGNGVTVTDQTGKQRKSVTDALGRLLQIYEAPNDVNLNYLTTYAYDVLDNLTTVTQGSQTRTFVYDSLKRLTSATNPERGTVNYQYDNNSNLLVKTDARGVSTHIEYDVLNRTTRRWYNGSSSPSATTHNSPALPSGVGQSNEAKWFYDSQTLPTGAPSYSRGSATGRLVAQTYGAGEVGEMPVSSPAKLLRVLQEHAIRPVGGITEIPVNVRVVAATNRTLPEEIQRGRFRQDLFFRLAVLTIQIPALRERTSDIRSLTEYFLSEVNRRLNRVNQLRINDDAIAALSRYSWPGNVRQLRHVIERLAVGAGDRGTVSANDVSQVLNEIRRFETPSEISLGFREDDSLDEFLARTTLGLYNHFRTVAGNHSEVARILGIHRNTLYLRVERARRLLRSS